MLDNAKLRKRLGTVRDVVYRNLMEEYIPFPIEGKIVTGWVHEAGVEKGRKHNNLHIIHVPDGFSL